MHAKLHNQWDLPTNHKLVGRKQGRPKDPTIDKRRKNKKMDEGEEEPLDAKGNCRYCHSSHGNEEVLLQHMLQNHKEELFHCRVCTEPFLMEGQLQGHIKRSHPHFSLFYNCPHCEKSRKIAKSFVSEKSLSYHVDEFHEDETLDVEKSFVCPVGFCQKRFRLEGSIYRHARMHNQSDLPDTTYVGRRQKRAQTKETKAYDDESKSPCVTCGKMIAPSQMAKHAKVHVTATCAECGKTFKSKVQLKVHRMNKHLKLKLTCPFEGCGKIFHRRVDLHSHVDRHNNPVRHQCNLCDKSFSIKHDLETHIKGVHEGIKSRCSFCGKEFVRPSEKNRHERSIHGSEFASKE